MLYTNGIANVLVTDVPQLEPDKVIVPDQKAMKRVVEIVPDTRPALFSLDVWDFSPCFVHIDSTLNVIRFGRADIDSRYYMKCYALNRLEAGFKVRTIAANVIKLISIINKATSLAGNFYCIQIEHIMEALEMDRATRQYVQQKLAAVINFYEAAESYGLKHLVDMEELATTRTQLQDITKFEKKHHKADIPEDYYNMMITVFNDVMRNPSTCIENRFAAGAFLVETQLGLRTNEVAAIPKDCLHWTFTSIGERPYIVYRSIKGARNSQDFKLVEHICTPLLKETLDYLLKLRETVPGADKNDYLFFNYKRPHTVAKADYIQDRYHTIMALHFPNVHEPHPGVPMRKLKECGKRPVCIPVFSSMRVHVFSTLANQGMPYAYIEKIMSHKPQSHCEDSYYGGVKPDRKEAEKRVLPDISIESIIPVLSR